MAKPFQQHNPETRNVASHPQQDASINVELQHPALETQHFVSLPVIHGGLSKKQLATLADHSVNKVLEEGHVFQVAETMSAMEEFVKCIRKDERFVQFLRDELSRQNGKLVTSSGAKIEACEAGVSYDYSANAEWKELDEQIRYLAEKKKMLEEKLKWIVPGKTVVDTDTGEVFEGPLKKSRSTYRVTLRKS